ncbi:MAG: AmmeMemoRadiSam system protein B [Deltaproteobacteria bacterium]|nr:AmmeMemoRadiSam system protein B [Deltaproteobacteria bacterium]
MIKIQKASVAGSFYPAQSEELREELGHYFQVAPDSTARPKAMIVPHAGTLYSGPIAASAYKTLFSLSHTIQQVVLLGPAHRLGFEGLAIPSADYFETPLGRIGIDQEKLKLIQNLPQVVRLDEAHQGEHSLEVQLPFLQMALGDFKLTPLVVGWSSPEAVAEVLEKLWGGEETLIVVSSDLSHYLDYASAQKIDRATADKIEKLDWRRLQDDQACGFFPLRGLLLEAQKKHLQVKTLALRNSGDTAGDKNRVVGYGAFYFYENENTYSCNNS